MLSVTFQAIGNLNLERRYIHYILVLIMLPSKLIENDRGQKYSDIRALVCAGASVTYLDKLYYLSSAFAFTKRGIDW